MMKGRRWLFGGVLTAAGLGALVFYSPVLESHHCGGRHEVQLACAHGGAVETGQCAAAEQKQDKENPGAVRNDGKREKVHPAEIVGNKLVCPVMEREFTLKKDSAYEEHGGKVYYFCCPGCAPRFRADPEKYAGEHEGRGQGHHRH